MHHRVASIVFASIVAAALLCGACATPTPEVPMSAPAAAAPAPVAVDAGVVSHVDVVGGTIAIEDHGGDGPLVLAVPGFGDLRSEYRFFAATLKDAGYRVVTMDLRGHGDSSANFARYEADDAADDVVAVLRHLDGGKAIVVGTSFGAAAVTAAAANAPDLVDRVVVFGPFVRDVELSTPMTLLVKVLFAGPWKTAAWVAYFDSLFPTTKPADHAARLAALKQNLGEPGRFDAVRAMMFAGRSRTAPLLSKVQAPVLVVMGSKDPDFKDPAGEAAAITALLTSTTTTTSLIDGAGHYPQAEMPAPAATAVLRFLRAPVASLPLTSAPATSKS